MVLNSFVTAGGSGLTRRLATYLTGSVFQPFIVIVDPIVSIGFSVWTYGETLTPDTIRHVVGSLAFSGMCAAATVLARSAPATMDPGPALTAAST